MTISELVKRVASVLERKEYTSPVDSLLGIDDEDGDSEGTTVLSIDRRRDNVSSESD